MKAQTPILLAGSVPLLFSCNPIEKVKEEPPRPNIVLIIADDVGWNDLGCYGHPHIRTPHIDSLAAHGLRFDNMYLTASSCSPSRCSLITGRYPHNTGAAELHTPLPENQIPFPALLKENGYYCTQAGKWHMGPHVYAAFDTAYGIPDGDTGGEGYWLTSLRERPKDKPFFLWLAAVDAHRPWSADTIPEPHGPGDAMIPPYFVEAQGTRSDLASYYNEIWRFDHYIGKVVEELKAQRVFSSTMVIVMSDNGRPFHRCKTRVLDSGMKTPFIIHWPARLGNKAGFTESMVSIIDLAPTLLDIMDIEIPEKVQGCSFEQLLYQPDQPFRNYVFAEHNWHDFESYERMVRKRDYLYVYNGRPELDLLTPADIFTAPSFLDVLKAREAGTITPAQADIFLRPRPREEIYNNNLDPYQTDNRVNDPKYGTILEEMRQVLVHWQKVTGDTEPENLTPDWFIEMTDYERSPWYGDRGTMSGSEKNATEINHKGPF